MVNNVGRGIAVAPSRVTDEDIDEMMRVNVKSSLYGMQAVLCACASDAPIGRSSSFEGGLPVSPELGFPENDAWRWITAAEIREYEQPTEANYRLLAEALRRAEDAPAQAGGLATRI